MKGYGQFCPVAKASEIIGERWTPLVLRELIAGSHRFNELRNGLPLISSALLTKRLKTLETSGIIQRRSGSDRHIEYHLTPAGEELGPLIMQLGVWGQRWARSRLDPEDLDPALLMWDIHRRVVTTHFPDRRTVVLFELTDAPAKFRRWWLLIEQGEADLCMKDPGFEIDLHIVTDVRTLTAIWIGQTRVATALSTGALQAFGASRLKNGMQSWLGLSVFAKVK